MAQAIVIEGAREHNLKNISLRLPRERLIVVTGPSGSGKSSLAFDTIYAEGHRRYVESLSTYARQFLERVEKPDVDLVEGISPAIAIQQRNPVKHSRSTVGTATEVYDYLRLLFAKVGVTHCPDCGRPVRPSTVQETVEQLLRDHPGRRALVLFPTGLGPGDALEEALGGLSARGFARVEVGGEVHLLAPGLGARLAPALGAGVPLRGVADRVVLEESHRARLADSLEVAFNEGQGAALVQLLEGAPAEGRGRAAEPSPHPAPPRGPLLRFSRSFECPDCGRTFEPPTPLLFSFNSPQGACPACGGFGNTLDFDPDLIVPDWNKTLAQGAVEPWAKPRYRYRWGRLLQELSQEKGLDLHKPFKDLSARERRWIFQGVGSFPGVQGFFERLRRKKYKVWVRVFIRQYQSSVPCRRCRGSRLREEALFVRVGGKTIAEVTALSVREALRFVEGFSLPPAPQAVAQDILEQLRQRLSFLEYVGVDYLTLDRLTRTLSGGEAQRINLANQLGAQLTGTLYILDEPTVGLHPRDNARLLTILRSLVERGNSLLVVEHDRDVISAADYLVDLGPRAGENGGEVVFAGEREEFLRAASSSTARYLRGEQQVVPPRPRPQARARGAPGGRLVARTRGPDGVRRLSLLGARENNLKGVDLHLPLGKFICITGVSGSGKSTLIHDTLYNALDRIFHSSPGRIGSFKQIHGFEHIRDVVLLDQNPIGRTPRSNPVTYIKAYDPIRRLFAETPAARRLRLGPGHFSFNVPGGRCEKCAGSGHLKVEMHFMADIFIRCPECEGRRFHHSALEVRCRGLAIPEVLELTVNEALQFFHDSPPVVNKLLALREVGLGYLRLGQPATTLSGGEAQRLKVAAQLASKPPRDVLYLLDEPTTGLHFQDVECLLRVLRRLVALGNTVVVIEHNLDVIRAADHIIDLGPEGGERGGTIVVEGPPEMVAEHPDSHTGRFLKTYLQRLRPAPKPIPTAGAPSGEAV
ncbi:MAG: excinuclease ABC subunit UvrA [Nitrospinota bacterium]